MNAPDTANGPPLSPTGPVAFGPFLLDYGQARLSRDGEPVALTGRPLAVLALLAARPGQLVSKDAVLDGVWGHREVSESVLKVAVNALRAALGDDARAPRYVETVARRGYRMVAQVRPLGDSTSRMAASSLGPEPPRLTPAAPRLSTAQPALIGREVPMAQLLDLLAAHRLVTLSGLGGVGKTRLALAVAAEAQARGHAWHDGVRVARFESLTEEALLVPCIAQALQLGSGASSSVDALARALAPLDLLLVLDNCEHLLEAMSALVAELLATAPRLTILATSQLPLRVAGEQVLPLRPLELPRNMADSSPEPDGYAAARLFCARVRQLMPGYTPSPAEHADIAAICRSLDGVPLALELAATRVPLLGTAGVRTRLSQRFELLTRGARDAAARQRSLTAALDWTYGLLAPAEQRSLQWLSVFAGSLTPDAAEAQLLSIPDRDRTAAPLDLVSALVDRSLLVPDATVGSPRLLFFNSVRRYALERLAQVGDEGSARAAHLNYLREFFERADDSELDTPAHRWLPPLRAELDNLRTALHFGFSSTATSDTLDQAQCLLASSVMFWARSGLRTEGQRWCETSAKRSMAATDTAMLLLHAQGVFCAYTQLGAPQTALESLRRSRPVLQERGDARRLYQSLYAERMLLMRLTPGADVAELLAAMSRLVSPDWNIVARRALAMLEAYTMRDRGDIDGYRQACTVLLAALQAEGADYECWPVANALGQALVQLGRIDEAGDVLGEAAAQVRSRGLQREQVPLLAINASVQLLRDGRMTSLEAAREAATLLVAEGMLWWMADALPWAAWRQGRHDDARRLQAWADAQVRRRGDQRGPFFSRVRADFAEVAGMPDDPAQGDVVGIPLSEPAALQMAFGRECQEPHSAIRRRGLEA